MSLSALSITLVATGTLITLIAGALWVRAWRGKATGWASCCRSCGFRLQGLNPDSKACPECGLDLGAAATLRPVTRSNEPARWGQAFVASCAGLMLVWIGQPTQLFRTGRVICASLPNGTLIGALHVMPTMAAGEIDDRLHRESFTPAEIERLAHTAAEIAATNPGDRPGPGARVLSALAGQWRAHPDALADALRTALAQVAPVAGSPRPCKPEGAFIVTAVLPAMQGANWITRNELRLTITGATVRNPDGSGAALAPLTAEGRGASREFDGAAFRAPSKPGTYACEIRVRMRQPGGAFEAETAAPFELRVLDPSMLQVTFASDARTAGLLREWLAKATSAVDAPGTGLLVALPGDFTALQAQPTVIAGALRVMQGDLSLDVGRVWIDEALPTISLFAAPMPATLDRTKPAVLRFTPDLAFAMGVASSSCTALGDTVEVPITLPPPPAPITTPSAPPSAAPAP